MKKITDERLILKNLKNIRNAYAIQTLGILSILGYDWITRGSEVMYKSPLWFVFIVSTTALTLFSMNISVDHEVRKKAPKRSLIISIVIIALISMAIGIFVPFTGKSGPINGLIVGGISFICILIPYIYIYYLRTKQQD
ncbi:hypothetical protein [Carnobacterium inhibens]|uniref:hypothetical protein n=1 Tax=Carnobacterium inhibens TaxID=147709 RepID=UPI0005537B77|nr:hypothetical protein [Carnobacterium inhibens]